LRRGHLDLEIFVKAIRQPVDARCRRRVVTNVPISDLPVCARLFSGNNRVGPIFTTLPPWMNSCLAASDGIAIGNLPVRRRSLCLALVRDRLVPEERSDGHDQGYCDELDRRQLATILLLPLLVIAIAGRPIGLGQELEGKAKPFTVVAAAADATHGFQAVEGAKPKDLPLGRFGVAIEPDAEPAG
jgi:hypothetical protein